MEILLGLGLLALFMTSLILPWIHRGRIRDLAKEVEALRVQVSGMGSTLRAPAPTPVQSAPPTYNPPTAAAAANFLPPASPAPKYAPPVSKPPKVKKPKISFERQFGARLPVWVGGIALALAGLFMVKYSIENELISPAVRLALGGFFGIALIGAGAWIREKKAGMADGARIAQALSGAGIADLYVCLFAGASLYQIISPLTGFIGMAAVTAAAVMLSLRHGAPIAVLGMVGGFLTPALIGSNEPNGPLLFFYLYCVTAGLLVVIRRAGWWWLSVPLMLCSFGWVLLWLLTSWSPPDTLWLGLFLIAVCVTMVSQSRKAMEEGALGKIGTLGLAATLNYLTLGGAALLMSALAFKAQFGMLEWGMFGLLSAGGMVLAYFNQKLYGLVPWIAMVVNVMMIALWQNAEPSSLAFVLACFALLNAGGGYVLMWRAMKSLPFALLSASAALIYYLLAYAELRFWLMPGGAFTEDASLLKLPLWGLIALALALLSANACRRILAQYAGENPVKQKLLAVFALTTTAFVSLGLGIELEREFLSVAFATEVLAVSWISTRVRIDVLRIIAGMLAVVFALILFPQILLLLQLTAYSIAELRLPLQQGVPIVNWPLFQLGVPAGMFIGASLLLRRERDDTLVRVLEVTAIALIGVMGYYLTRKAFHADENVLFVKASFVERGVITNILFAYGFACLLTGRHFARRAVIAASLVLTGIALFRLAWFDLFIYNPAWTHYEIHGVTLFNTLLLPFGLPMVWLALNHRLLTGSPYAMLVRYSQPFLLVLAFALITLNVRQFYHGEYLDTGPTENAEIYSYSVAWLLLGLGLLFAGTLRQEKMLRVASLALVIISVLKVFLYDASELTGLLRVFSFLGLGFSLIGLSWFYTRFVFRGAEE